MAETCLASIDVLGKKFWVGLFSKYPKPFYPPQFKNNLIARAMNPVNFRISIRRRRAVKGEARRLKAKGRPFPSAAHGLRCHRRSYHHRDQCLWEEWWGATIEKQQLNQPPLFMLILSILFLMKWLAGEWTGGNYSNWGEWQDRPRCGVPIVAFREL